MRDPSKGFKNWKKKLNQTRILNYHMRSLQSQFSSQRRLPTSLLFEKREINPVKL